MRTIVRTTGLALGLATAGLLGTAQTARAADAPLSPWRDPAVLEKRLAQACDAVERETGAKYEKRPTVRIATAKDLADALSKAEGVLEPAQRSERSQIDLISTFLFAF